MFSRTNIEERLLYLRNKRIQEQAIMEEVQQILAASDQARKTILSTLNSPSSEKENKFDFDLLQSERIFHITDIKQICLVYRLRFLDSRFFKGAIPEEAISKIRLLEKEHNTSLTNFKIVAPAKLLKLENADDPLLFAPMGNGYFYLIHKWGKDLHSLRKWLMWPFKSLENLVFVIFLLSVAVTALTPMRWFTESAGNAEYIFLFLFIFKALGGLALYFGMAKGKNFNGVVWESKFYNA